MKSDLFYALAQVILKNCLTYSYSNNADTWQFNAINQDSQKHKIKVKGNYRVNNSASLKQALIAGIYPERQYLPTKVRAFLDFLIEHLGTDVPFWDNF